MKQAGQLTSRNSTHSSDNKELQLTFVEEEFYELLHAWNHEERKDVIKEATDVLWVTYGLLHLLSFHFLISLHFTLLTLLLLLILLFLKFLITYKAISLIG